MASNSNWWNFMTSGLGPFGAFGLANSINDKRLNKTPATYAKNNVWGDIVNALSFNWNKLGTSGKPTAKELGDWFKNNYTSEISNANVLDYLNNMSDEDLGALILDNEYYNKTKDPLTELSGLDTYTLDTSSILNDIRKLANLPEAPEMYDAEAIKSQINQDIDAENQNILGLYDKNLDIQKNIYANQMSTLNRGYNDYARQVLSNDYQKNATLMGALSGSLDKSRRNALEAGANAGLKIAGNINTVMSAQNKQTATSLETANNLAQQLLNQQNAAMGISNNWANTLSQDTQNRASLQRGNVERKQSAYTDALSNAQLDYNNKMDRYNEATAATRNSTPFGESYINYNKQKRYSDTY